MGEGVSTSSALPPNQPSLTPVKLIQTYSADDWEAFIEEWAEGFQPPYNQIVRLAGAGDKGRDVLGHIAPPEVRPRPCDLYQCKHYDHPLRPKEVLSELGKLCVYTHQGDYPLPRSYRFVPPRSVGPALHDLLNNPDRLRAELIQYWDTHCRKAISTIKDYPLEGDLRAHVDGFDFSIVWYLTPQEIVAQHQRTKHWSRRFRIDPPVRPALQAVPLAIQNRELPYVQELLDVYAELLQEPIAVDQLAGRPSIQRHFTQNRGLFYSAEELARFSRDHFAPGAFEHTKQNIHDGVYIR